MTLPDLLTRRFRIIVLALNGTTALPWAEAGTARPLLEALLQGGVQVAVLSGGGFLPLNRQLSAAIRGPHKRHLYLLANHGAEIYGFDAASRPVLLHKRVVTPEEDRRLTEVAEAVRDTLRLEAGLEVEVVYDGPNRRKVDLIPLPEWRRPLPSARRELLKAVRARLRAAGLWVEERNGSGRCWCSRWSPRSKRAASSRRPGAPWAWRRTACCR